MAEIVDSPCVLTVRNLKESTQFYIDVLGFRPDPIEASGWRFLARDNIKCQDGIRRGISDLPELRICAAGPIF